MITVVLGLLDMKKMMEGGLNVLEKLLDWKNYQLSLMPQEMIENVVMEILRRISE